MKWLQLMAGVKSQRSMVGFRWAEPGAQLHVLHLAIFLEGDMGRPWFVGPPALGRPRLKHLLYFTLVNLDSVNLVSLNQGNHLEKCNPLENLHIQRFNEPSVKSR